MNTSTNHSPVSVTPAARSLLGEIQAATNAGHAYPDLPTSDPRNEALDDLLAELLIESADGVGWRAVAVDPE